MSRSNSDGFSPKLPAIKESIQGGAFLPALQLPDVVSMVAGLVREGILRAPFSCRSRRRTAPKAAWGLEDLRLQLLSEARP